MDVNSIKWGVIRAPNYPNTNKPVVPRPAVYEDNDESTVELRDHPKIDAWGLPCFVDEWGCETEYDEEPAPKFTEYFAGSSVTSISSGYIDASKITAGRIIGASFVSAPITPPATP